MKWTVLSDNRSGQTTWPTEHGLSIYLETDRCRLLLDTGASDLFLRNAEKMDIDLSKVDMVFISHGHSDHAGGLKYLLKVNDKAKVVVSPHAFGTPFYSRRKLLHSITTDWPSIPEDRLLLVDHTMELEYGIRIITPIAHEQDTPKGNQFLFVQNKTGDYVADDFRHEMVLYVEGFLFTGCAHSGLENILKACPWPVRTVVGGFHLLDGMEDESTLNALAQQLVTHYPDTRFFTSHCTGDVAFAILQQKMCKKLQNFHVGMIFNE